VRIGLFCDMYTPHISGVTEYIRLHKAELERLGHEAWVVTFGNQSLKDAEFNVVRCAGAPWGSTGWNVGVRYPKSLEPLVASLDIAHLNHPVLSGQLALAACRRHNVPTVFTNHSRYDLYSDVYASLFPRTIRHRVVGDYLRRFLGDVSGVVAPTPSIAEWLEDFAGFGGAEVIPGGIDVDTFSAPNQPVTRLELGVPSSATVYCFAGRLAHEKDPLLLLEAFATVAAQRRDARLLLIGDGPARPNLTGFVESRQLEEQVIFAGEQPHERVADFLAVADVFVSASTSETQGLSLLECMAAGLPAVCFRAPGMQDVVVDGANGLLTEREPRLLAEAMLELADAPRREAMAAEARSTAIAHDVKTVTPRMLDYYDRVRG
jgi:1,2-diacylglycerol 3-alpha-glucosyltransferase